MSSLPEGSPSAKLYFIGSHPYRLAPNEFLGGGAGRIFNKMLSDCGILKSQCRFFNIDGNVEAVLEDIRRVKPNVVVPLGSEAMEALLGWKGIKKWRGSVLWGEKTACKVLPTHHPEDILVQWDFLPLTCFDLKKAKREADSPAIERTERTLHINLLFDECVRVLVGLKDRKKPIAFDIETTRSDTHPPKMTSIAFADSPTEGWCIPFCQGDGTPCWSVDQELELLVLINSLLTDKDIPKIAQNAQFDMSVLSYSYGIHVQNLLIDTMCAFHCIYSELPKSLATLCSLYTNQPYYKDWSGKGFDSFQRYNTMDAVITFECATKIEEEMKEFHVSTFYHTIINPLIQVLLRMQLTGVKVDEDMRELAALKTKAQYLIATEKLDLRVGHPINAHSPKQLKDLLYKELGMKAKVNKGKITTNEQSLRELANSHKEHSEVMNLILEAREQKKLLSTYLEVPLRNGRMHTSYNIGGRVKNAAGDVISAPETGRLSSSESLATASGTNLQNVPKGICRKVFIPDPGKIWFSVDLSQVEARVVACVADSGPMLKIFHEGKDIHRFNAALCLRKRPEDVTKEERDFFKRGVHAFNYGESAFANAKRTGISLEEAERNRDAYLSATGLRRWHYDCERQLMSSRIVLTAMGRKRIFFGRAGKDLIKQRIAFEPQSITADLISIILIRLDSVLQETKMDAQLLLQVHDEICGQCRKEDWPLMKDVLKWAFHYPLKIGRHVLVVPEEIKVGSNWNDVKEEK